MEKIIKKYRMMDVTFSVECNEPGFFDMLEVQPWVEKENRSNGEADISAEIDFSSISSIPSRIRVGEKVFDLIPETRHYNAYILLMEEVINRNRRYLMIHGGAVYKDGNAYAFVGPSNSGKSTLLYALSREGFSLVADDLLLLDINEMNIIILRESIGLRRGSLKFFGIDEEECNSKYPFKDDTKAFLNVERELINHDADIILKTLFIFSNVFEDEGRHVADLFLKSWNDAFIEKITEIPGVKFIDKYTKNGVPVCRLSVMADASNEFQVVCKDNENHIFYTEAVNAGVNDFANPPLIKKISKRDAVLALIKNMRNPRILRDTTGNRYPELMLRLGTILEGVDTYSFKPGILDKTVNEIKNIICDA
ncbi:MAG: hypothetical protein HZA77_06255 [Candidatus Schekmanbacteria bacterium]|nr:hypothetical protein [Candidatus Schekmanbacteria bacterium]